jgi:hypothetical protein
VPSSYLRTSSPAGATAFAGGLAAVVSFEAGAADWAFASPPESVRESATARKVGGTGAGALLQIMVVLLTGEVDFAHGSVSAAARTDRPLFPFDDSGELPFHAF